MEELDPILCATRDGEYISDSQTRSQIDTLVAKERHGGRDASSSAHHYQPHGVGDGPHPNTEVLEVYVLVMAARGARDPSLILTR